MMAYVHLIKLEVVSLDGFKVILYNTSAFGKLNLLINGTLLLFWIPFFKHSHLFVEHL